MMPFVAALALLMTTPPPPSPSAPEKADAHHERTDADPFRLEAVRGGVYVLYGRGGNVGVTFSLSDAASMKFPLSSEYTTSL